MRSAPPALNRLPGTDPRPPGPWRLLRSLRRRYGAGAAQSVEDLDTQMGQGGGKRGGVVEEVCRSGTRREGGAGKGWGGRLETSPGRTQRQGPKD